ncbi:TAF2 Transcription initiation factor TFIID subunit 2 [Candida maltosa Xu316]
MDIVSNSGTPRVLANTPRTIGKHAIRKPNSFGSQQPFKVGHQRVNIDVDLTSNSIHGLTELTILPTSNKLKVVKLDCREITIKDVLINGSRNTNYVYDDLLYINNPEEFDHCIQTDKINITDLYSDIFGVHQHHLIKKKLDYIFGIQKNDESNHSEFTSENTQELKILLPDTLKLELTDINAIQTPGGTSRPGTATPSYMRSKNTGSEAYFTPITIKIVYEARNLKNGINFVTSDDIEKRLWHAYTLNDDFNVSTSSWVPCVDNLSERYTWSLEVNVPRTLKDLGNPRIIGSKEAFSYQQNQNKRGTNKRANEQQQEEEDEDDDDDEDESDNLDLVVVSGDFNNVKETPHPVDLSKKVVSWSIFNPVCAHHVGWAIGCFESFTFPSGTADTSNDDDKYLEKNGNDTESTNSSVTVYAFKEDVEWARNTCIITNKALDYFSKEYGSFPFSSYGIVFVRYAPYVAGNFAGLSIFSTELLYPANMIEPMFTTTDVLVQSMATQWAGINISPQTFNDMWCTLGISGFMAISFIKKLMGSNEFRFRVRRRMEQIVAEDVGKHPIADNFIKYPVSTSDLSFACLKAPIVLFILDNRMTKTDKSFGLSRVLPKLFLQAMSGDLPNGTLSTEHFRYVCEKVNRNKLDNFFKQWVFGSGAPVFRISQRFNKKKGMIEMNIRQIQHHENTNRPLKKSEFIDRALSYLESESKPTNTTPQVFTGPMTIRVHESDGSPYEHIVDLKEGNTKLDIQYNSKFRKIKKKDEGIDPGIPFNQFGDVLSSESEMVEWNLKNWSKRDEESLSSEPFEWIRGDVDFEWIARIEVKQPDFMFGSQLIYDRDIEAQLEAVRYFGELEKTNAVYCTVLLRTLMDVRYFYGVRIAAADALASCSNEANNFIGVDYLLKAYTVLYCFPGSTVPKSNDFNDFRSFMLQKSFPKILSSIKDNDGKVPNSVKQLVLNLVKFNDNSMNNFNDNLYICELIESLTTCAISGWRKDMIESNNHNFVEQVVSELRRLQKLDYWIPSYRNVIEIMCIKQSIRIALAGASSYSMEDLLLMTLDKYPMKARVEAFKGVLELGGLKNKSVLHYFLQVCLLNHNRPLYRRKLVGALLEAVSAVAVFGGVSMLDDPEFKTKLESRPKDISSKIIIDEGNPASFEMQSKHDELARANVKGALQILRRDFAHGKGLQAVIWELIHSSLIGINERRNLFLLCQILYKEIDKYVLALPVPSLPVADFLRKKFVAKTVAHSGSVVIKREGRFKIQLASRKSVSFTPRTQTKSEGDHKPLKISLKPVVHEPKPKIGLVKIDPHVSTKVTLKVSSDKLATFRKRVEVNGTSVMIRVNGLSIINGDVHRYVKIDTKRRKIEVSKTPFPVVSIVEKEEEDVAVKEIKSNNGDDDVKEVEPKAINKEKKKPKIYIHFGGNTANTAPSSNTELDSVSTVPNKEVLERTAESPKPVQEVSDSNLNSNNDTNEVVKLDSEITKETNEQ